MRGVELEVWSEFSLSIGLSLTRCDNVYIAMIPLTTTTATIPATTTDTATGTDTAPTTGSTLGSITRAITTKA